jgi:hypothetical protein
MPGRDRNPVGDNVFGGVSESDVAFDLVEIDAHHAGENIDGFREYRCPTAYVVGVPRIARRPTPADRLEVCVPDEL